MRKTYLKVRSQIDGETENLDREKGEAYIDEAGFKQIIKDTENNHNLFLVAEVDGKIVGFSRCEGNKSDRRHIGRDTSLSEDTLRKALDPDHFM
jgi:ribosomal protein S18 acetylase RimI-like enzyme